MKLRFGTLLVLTTVFVSAVSVMTLKAQNTAPVPSTFEIVSPSDGNPASLINHDYSANTKIFYGGDFFYPKSETQGFAGFTDPTDIAGTRIARGNPNGSRLTLGATEQGTDPDFPTTGAAVVANLPGGWTAGDFDPDDEGDIATQLNYGGANGFISINEGDTLEINITGFIDPNNKLLQGDQNADDNYTGRYLRSQSGDSNPGNDGKNAVTFSALNLPERATFNGTKLVWVPSFVQGDGTYDNNLHGGKFFVDANISDGGTGSEVSNDTVRTAAHVGVGLGELRDSLYVIYFKATDDAGMGPDNAIDSLFIIVNDSLPNPGPRFTSRTILRIDSLDIQQTRKFNYLSGNPDTLFSVFEGDSVVITINAEDQDSLQGEDNDKIAFSMLWNDNLLGVSKGGDTTSTFSGFNSFIKRRGTVDELVYDTLSTVDGNGSAKSFRIKLQVPFNLAASGSTADTLVVLVCDGTTIVADTLELLVKNVNRSPIWDNDTSSTPTDSVLVFSSTPGISDSVQAVQPMTLNNEQTDSTYFSAFVYDPDFLVGDSLGYPLTYAASGNHQGTLNSTTSLNVFSPVESDTVTYSFSITATDGDSNNPLSTLQAIYFRVAPAPVITSVTPRSGGANTEVTIKGRGFGLFDNSGVDTSKVFFYAYENGRRQNVSANIISWSKTKIVISVPSGLPNSPLDASYSYLLPDTLRVVSAIYGGFDNADFIVVEDSSGFENIEVTNITSTSATIRYRTNFTGADSLVLGSTSDTLDIHSAAFTTTFNKLPTFVEENNGALTTIVSSVDIFQDETSSSDGIHVIELSDLAPGTTYQFFIASGRGYFSADSTRNVNGPYTPKKIDRNTAASNSYLDAFRFKTVPANGSSGEVYTLTGKVYYGSGAPTGAIVSVKLVDNDNSADTSLTISSTVNSDSTWDVNLANLKKTDGSTFIHGEGDYILIEVDGSEMGFQQYDTTRAAGGVSPMVLNNIKLTSYVDYNIDFSLGLNLIGIPLQLARDEVTKADNFLDKIQGGTPSITRYVSATGTQQTRSRAISGSYVGASNFDLVVTEAYFVETDFKVSTTFGGRAYTVSTPTVEFPNSGLYFVSRPAQDSDLFYSWDASGILNAIPEVETVYRWNVTKQGYEQYFRSPAGGLVGDNFALDVGEGYIFDVTDSSGWDPNGIQQMLLAGASNSGSGVSVNEKVIVLNSQGGSGIDLERNLVTNITSAAAVISFTSDEVAYRQIRISNVDGTEEQVIKILANTENVNTVDVLGLNPETEYSYRIENESGLPISEEMGGTFTTTPIGASSNVFILYGSLAGENGESLYQMMVLLRLENTSSGVRSQYVSTMSDRDGLWDINLANLKEEGSGEPYVWQEGDKVEMIVLANGRRYNMEAVLSGASPHNLALDIESGTGVDNNAGKDTAPVNLPKAYKLSQNFPNPFNPSTTIQYALPDGHGSMKVKLDIYNLRGQLVKTLVDEAQEAGNYRVQWNGVDSRNNHVSSGVYFYRLVTPEYSATRKMVILK